MSEKVIINLDKYNKLKKYEKAEKNKNTIYWEYVDGRLTPSIHTENELINNLSKRIKKLHEELEEYRIKNHKLLELVLNNTDKEKIDRNFIDKLIEKFSVSIK